MKDFGTFQKIYLHRLPVDGRKQINGLSQIVSAEMDLNPHAEGLFVFTNKSKSCLKLVYWDRTGFAMWVKKLEKNRFKWPIRADSDVVSLSTRELSWLLEGLDILSVRPHASLEFNHLN